ncbi:isochorismate lyase [Undibacterium squillarum]|uniref:chorismate mutase n=1 Tax=Undibacterium squillarum TaxID=1131567 RepID=A0ABQ2XUM1_9BURK|nr:isochorismate lyase [Undibacterium squillarum]GGX33821.1 hypothetical protein GCM10010946_08570 [Undibacterium squillarum]
MNSLTPQACTGLDDIRAEIDQIDQAMIRLIGTRRQYVMAAARFKTDPTAVGAPERFKTMLEKRRQWATENGVHPDLIEKLYSDLVHHFIKEEMQHWQALQAS